MQMDEITAKAPDSMLSGAFAVGEKRTRSLVQDILGGRTRSI